VHKVVVLFPYKVEPNRNFPSETKIETHLKEQASPKNKPKK